jgi:hypothetical protein
MSPKPSPWIHPGAIHEPSGSLVEHRRGAAYRIEGVEHLAPFLMSIVSSSDHWLFASSTGGLTCGRVEASRALLPYETDDRLHAKHGFSGPLTLVRAWTASGASAIWEPLDDRAVPIDRQRRLTKGIHGTWVEYEEVDVTLGLVFRMTWSTSGRFGFVRDVELERLAGSRVTAVEVLDGLVDVMPALVPLGAQQTSSTLIDAYKRVDVDGALKLGIHALEARLSDRAEPAEALRANVVWSTGAAIGSVLASCAAPRLFREGRELLSERLVTGQRGAHLVHVPRFELGAAGSVRWRTVADVHVSAVDIEALRAMLASRDVAAIDHLVDEDVAAGEAELVRLVASADGLQHTKSPVATAHHFANVLFNVARGGGSAARAHLPRVPAAHLQRRHGDPSRPWNSFDIRVKNADGSRAPRLQGNWRDIFQNWEALCLSYPGVPRASSRGSSTRRRWTASTRTASPATASTGRCRSPEDPWGTSDTGATIRSSYLVRLLELSEQHRPARSRRASHANLHVRRRPLRLRPHAELVVDPRADDHLRRRRPRARRGAPGERGLRRRATSTAATGARAPRHPGGEARRARPVEALSLVVGGGIWMNTQRPEWNDANNALVGTGVSVVTLAHLARYLHFLARLLGPESPGRIHSVSREVVTWLRELQQVFEAHAELADAERVTDDARRTMLDALGEVFTRYRTGVYAAGVSEVVELSDGELHAFFSTALRWVLSSLRANRREDGLYHSYNLLALEGSTARLGRLPVMLEGQVAVLGSRYFSHDAVPAFLRALFASELWREDQQSFVLYPAHDRPRFLDKNVVPPRLESELVRRLVDVGERSIVARDARGQLRFAGDLASARDLAEALDRLAAKADWSGLVERDRAALLDAWEETFHHHAFTGRSGTMHKYEGIGCIYWHMVAKLLVAIQELTFEAGDHGAPREIFDELRGAYFRVRAGLGHEKTPAVWGAFPTDPYSHSPVHLGAQQPGMTGVVKEEILTRLGELGIRLSRGRLFADGALLSEAELTAAPVRWAAGARSVELPARAVGLTVATVPIVVEVVDGEARARVTHEDGRVVEHRGTALDPATTTALVSRAGGIARVDFALPAARLGAPGGAPGETP